MEETYKFSAVIYKEEKWYVSWCPELDVASQGETIEEAIDNLKEAVELYLEDEDVQIPATGSILIVYGIFPSVASIVKDLTILSN